MSFMDKAKNKAEEIAGKAKEATGDATSNENLKRDGQTDQGSAHTKQAGENVKDVFKGDK
ncbi:uncharacterized protein YjbJ (UPF0337 family) [Arthrobacter sp. CAN_A212]|uniref:CsbD family protein n=1 Tax=Arthrobacter sp. CAN_A212 TaxID=2787719 RepID=UPI0018CBB98C